MYLHILLTILAILPGLAICYLIYRLDKYEKEQRQYLIICFALGMLATLPAFLVEKLANNAGFQISSSLWMTLLVSLFAVGLNEELFKFLGLRFYAFPQKFFNEPFDGIVYSVMIGMGFATLENVLYANQFGVETTVIRAFTAVPAHGVFAIIMGYYAGLAKFDPLNRIKLLSIGFGIAVAAHSFYDFLILQQSYDWLLILAIILLWASIYFVRNMIKKHQESSPFKEGAISAETLEFADEIIADIEQQEEE